MLEKSKREREQGLRTIRAVREYDVKILEKETALSALKRELAERENAFAAAQSTHQTLNAQLADTRTGLTEVLAALQRTAADQGLVENLSAIQHSCGQLRQTGRNGTRKRSAPSKRPWPASKRRPKRIRTRLPSRNGRNGKQPVWNKRLPCAGKR